MMTEVMWRVIAVLIKAHYAGPVSYMALWHIQEQINDADFTVELEGCGCPGDPAITELLKLGLIEELPDLHCRYRIVIKGA